jgi:hypothetical protein
VFAFRGSGGGEPEHRFVLAGLDPRQRYHLHFEDGSSPDIDLTGQRLMSGGVTVMLPLPLSSEIISLSANTETSGRRASSGRLICFVICGSTSGCKLEASSSERGTGLLAICKEPDEHSVA